MMADPAVIPSRPTVLETYQTYGYYRYMMFALPIAVDAHFIVETGLSMGDSTRIFLESLSQMSEPEERRLYSYELPHEYDNLKSTEAKIRAIGFKAQWHVKWKDSVQSGKEFSEGRKVDLMYVDSDHTYEQVYSELDAWAPHFHDKTLVLGDDIWLTDPQNHPRLNTHSHGTNPIDPYYAARDWAEKNNYKITCFTEPNGKFLLYRR